MQILVSIISYMFRIPCWYSSFSDLSTNTWTKLLIMYSMTLRRAV